MAASNLTKNRIIATNKLGKFACSEIETHCGKVLEYLSIPYAMGRRFQRAEALFSDGAAVEKSELALAEVRSSSKNNDQCDRTINSYESFCFPQRSIPTWINCFLKHHMMRSEWSVKGDTPSEDAFVVNIWTRSEPQNDPVLVFIHGSGDCNSGTTPIYNGANLAARGVVVVTITYRIGRFGYMPVFDGERLVANLAYFDQQLALKWIRENIANFGGDSSNITLMGHSGGALAANNHYLNAESNQYFDKLILCGGPVPNIEKKDGLRDQFDEMLAANGLESLEALRRLDANRIIKLKKAGMKEVLDGEFFKTPSAVALERAKQPDFDGKPVLIGSNADEFSMIELPMYYKFMGIARKEKDLSAALEKHYGKYASELRSAFEPESEGAVDLQIKILEALVFHHSVYRLINTYSCSAPVYGYRMNYVPNLYGGLRGAYHGAELALFFDNLDKMNIEISDDNKKQVERLQRDWLSFIRTGSIPDAKPYKDSKKIIIYEGTSSRMAEFPHAELLERMGETGLTTQMMKNYLAGR